MPYSLGKRLAITGAAVKDVTLDGTIPDLDISGATIVRITSAVNTPKLSGINNTTDGRIVVVQNLSGASIDVLFGATSGPSALRFMNGSGTVTMATSASMTFRYDGTRQRWALLGYSI